MGQGMAPAWAHGEGLDSVTGGDGRAMMASMGLTERGAGQGSSSWQAASVCAKIHLPQSQGHLLPSTGLPISPHPNALVSGHT